MATQAEPAKSIGAVGPEGPHYMARQPILDLRGKAHGYQILIRSGLENGVSEEVPAQSLGRSENTAPCTLESMTGGLPAFVVCSEEALQEQLAEILPPGVTVLELHDSQEPAPSLVALCEKLKGKGFRLAVHDFVFKPGLEPLLELASYVKCNVNKVAPALRQEYLRRLGSLPLGLIAEDVDNQDQFLQARTEGFKYFQGAYFLHPAPSKSHTIPANRLFHIQILKLLHNHPVDFRKLGELVKQDAALTYRLLRLVNSPLCAIRQEVRSVETALLAVGEDNFRHIATLAIANELNANQPIEVLRLAFVRGRFCELAASQSALDPGEQYLLGLLSLLPAMMSMPMDELTPSLPLRDNIRQALHGTSNRERKLLDWLEAHEHGDWATADSIAQSHTLSRDRMMHFYGQSVTWAEAALGSMM